MVVNGVPLASVYCPLDWPADTPPVWTLGIRDWATDVTVTSVLQSYYAFEGDIAEFRYWNRPLSLQEIQDNYHRTLNSTEIKDTSLVLYLDPDNIKKNVVADKSSTKRLNGYLGGTLGEFVQSPQVIPTSAPIVDVNALQNATSPVVLQIIMKESGVYPSIKPFSIFAIDDANGNALVSGTSLVTMSIATLPDPSVLQISLTPDGAAFSTSTGPLQVYSNNTFYARHIANDNVASWPAQSFLVAVTENNVSRSVLVNITITKNAAPIVGTNGGAIVPPTIPNSYQFFPYRISNFRWPNSSINAPITWEYWFVVPADTRTLYVPELILQGNGRINSEVGKNLVFDYGYGRIVFANGTVIYFSFPTSKSSWNYGSGRSMIPIRTSFGMWHHAAMTSGGLGGLQKLYIDGELIDVQPGDIAGKKGTPSDENSMLTLNFHGSIPIDEFRIWTKNRTQDEIKSTMRTRLTGREPNLYLYHNFDQYTVNADGSYLFKDLSYHGFDLTCSDYNSPQGCPLVDSQVPIGGIIKNITFVDGQNATYWDPEGTDPDDDTRYLRFVIDQVPKDAKLVMDANVTYRFLDSDKRDNQVTAPDYSAPISVGSYIRREFFTPAVKIVPTVNGGGNPYDSFTYHVTDRLRNSASATLFIFRKCSPGYRLDNVAKRCIACDPGYYLPSYSYVDTCLPCPAGTAQPLAGQSTCAACLSAVFASTSSNTNSTANNNDTSISTTPALVSKKLLPKTTIGIDGILFYGTYQDSIGQASCLPCLSLSYAIQSNAQSCDGQAFVPNYISLLSPSVNVKSLNGTSAFSTLVSSNNSILSGGIGALDSTFFNDLADIETSPQNVAGVVTPAKAVVTTSVLMVIVTILCLIGVFALQKDPVIKASSPSSITIAGIGIIIGFLSVIPGSLKPSNGVCIVDIWMIPIAFSIVMGISISKTFRILRIFNNPRAMKIRMTNLELFGYMLVAVAINAVILVIWTLFDPPVPTIVQRGSTPGMVFWSCASKSATSQSIFTAVLYLYNIFLLIILSLLAYFTRTVNALFSESKYIGIFVATVIGCLAIFVSILYLPSNDVTTIYVMKSIAILIVSTSAMVTLIAIKFYTVFQNRTGAAGAGASANKPLMGTSTTSGTGTTVTKSGKTVTSVLSIVQGMYKNRPGIMMAGVVLSVKRFGVVFWKPKLAMLMIEERMLLLVDADPAKQQNPATAGIPESTTIPLGKFSVTIPDPSSAGQSRSVMTSGGAQSSGGGGTGSVNEESGVGGSSSGITLLTITIIDSLQVVTIQFERASLMRECVPGGSVGSGSGDGGVSSGIRTLVTGKQGKDESGDSKSSQAKVVKTGTLTE
ncbi:Gamma-aminobutyric acid type B receptor subunit 2 [Blyttiomyces sp. JEL0837]|nr:Gamma-aminobutyric acid type B receptor subunit 2 [Blyttiomyces sp. JEL0837]